MEDTLKTLAPPSALAKGTQVTQKGIAKIRSAMEKEGISMIARKPSELLHRLACISPRNATKREDVRVAH
jgi:hypothetical protein